METELGEKILTRCLGQCMSGHPEIRRERWGVFFLTSSSFYFKTFKENPGFLDSLVRRKKPKEEDVNELIFGIPFEAIVSADLPKPKRTWQKIFTRPDEKTSFIYNDETGEKLELVYTIATGQDEFFKIFRALLP